MTFGQAISTCFRKFVTFRGRARRSEYWYFYLFAFLVSLPAAVIDAAITQGTATQPLSSLASLVLLLPRLSVAVRRLHDVNYSGWFIGGFVAYLVVGAASLGAWSIFEKPGTKPFESSGSTAVLIAFILSVFVWLVWLFVLSVLKGTDGPNRYGEDPMGPNVDVFS